MLGQRRDIARLQSDFYRNQYRKMVRWVFASIFIMFLLIAAIIYLILFEPASPYYANTAEGKILAMPRVAYVG